MTAGLNDRHADLKAVESQNRTAIKVAWISSIAAVIGPIISGVASCQAGQASVPPSPTVTVTTTETVTAGQPDRPVPTVTVTVIETAQEQGGGAGGDGGTGGNAVYLMDLTPSGDALSDGPQRLGGTTYKKSLTWRTGCGDSRATTVYRLNAEYNRFQATVGLTDAEDATGTVAFRVYADMNGNGEADDNEEVGSKAATRDRPAFIDVPLHGAETVILRISTSACYVSTAVWGDPRVS